MKAQSQPPAARKKVLIVDDHPLVREGLAKVINQQHDLVVCGDAGDAPGGLSAIDQRHPDVVIVDISLEEGSGLDLIKNVHARYPRLPILVLSMHHESLYAERAVHAGAQGYVMKREPVSAVLDALRKLLAGHTALSEDVVSHLIRSRAARRKPDAYLPNELLSDRELEVFRLLGQGIGTRRIAARLRVAASTIESYRVSIKQKLGIGNATELVARAAAFVAEESRL